MKRAIIFPGQGSQVVGMGKDLAEAIPECKALFDQANENPRLRSRNHLLRGTAGGVEQIEPRAVGYFCDQCGGVPSLEAQTTRP